MTAWLIVIGVGLLGGVAAGFQGPLASVMGRHVGMMGSIFIIHVGGALAAACFLRVPGWADLSAWRAVPWYALAAGVLGLLLVGAFTFCVPRIGAGSTFTLIIVAQLAVGAFLDHFGIFVEHVKPFDLTRLAGIFILLVGTWLVVR